MSVEAQYNERDTRRVQKAKKEGRRPSELRPVPKPTGWRVRWRPAPGTNPISRTFLKADGFDRRRVDEIDAHIRRVKRENNGYAYPWMVFGGPDPGTNIPTLRDFALDRYVEHLDTYMKPRVRKDYLKYLDTMVLHQTRPQSRDDKRKARKKPATGPPTAISQMPLDEIRGNHVVEWLDRTRKLGWGKRTVQLAFDALQSVFALALELELVKVNPTYGVKRRRRGRAQRSIQAVKPRRVVDPVTIERVRRFLELADKMRDWMIMGLMTYLGLRPNEVVVLFWHELVDEQGRARATLEVARGSSDGVEGETKTGEYRVVKVFAPVRQDIERYYEWSGRPAGDERVFLNAQWQAHEP